MADDQRRRDEAEEYLANLNDADFDMVLKRVRPPQTQFTSSGKDLSDPADRQRAVFDSINAKQQRSKQRGPVNANGYRGSGRVNASPGLNPVLPTDTDPTY